MGDAIGSPTPAAGEKRQNPFALFDDFEWDNSAYMWTSGFFPSYNATGEPDADGALSPERHFAYRDAIRLGGLCLPSWS
jgi:hypothetical protein